MKKLVVFFALFVWVSVSYAQLRVNPKVGVNFSALTTEDADWEEDGTRVGVNAGIDFRVGDDGEDWFYFQPGLHFYSIGAQLINEANAERIDDVVGINSIKVPLNAGVFLTGSRDGVVAVRINGGIVPTFLIGVEDNNLGLDRDDFEALNLGLNAGLGIDIFLVTLDFGYEWGLTEFFETGQGKNRIFGIALGLVFP